MKLPPIVYVGPTLDPALVKRYVPRVQLMPPIGRGDLYRDRSLGFRVFLILDGVFLQQLAISPREIIDVLRDGAVVFGASSMGAIRAAECWPVGMRGVGSIYRLYRRGALTSDDEVAVTFAPRPPYPAATVSLVNVRYAAMRALRAGLLTRCEIARVIQVASEQHFTDRAWPAILDAAGIRDTDDRRLQVLKTYDLKALDGLRALKTLQRSAGGRLEGRSAARIIPSGLLPAIQVREPVHSMERRPVTLRETPTLWRWLVATGRYRRYMSGFGVGIAQYRRLIRARRTVNRENHADVALEAAEYVDQIGEVAPGLKMSRSAVAAALVRGRSSARLLSALLAQPRVFAPVVWADISALGDTEAIIRRFTALQKAIERARLCSLEPEARDYYLARVEIANNHGYQAWPDVESALAGLDILRIVEHAVEELALAKRVRRELFQGSRRAIDARAPSVRSGLTGEGHGDP